MKKKKKIIAGGHEHVPVKSCECKLICPFASEFFRWIQCTHLDRNDRECMHRAIGHGGSWCTTMLGKAMLGHKTWIGNDY